MTRRSLKTQQHAHQAVFHTDRLCVRPGSTLAACRQARNQAVQQYPVEAPGLASVYWQSIEVGALDKSISFREKQFFTESLILAQDERWRRA
jgi:hypothetical protein